MFAKPINLILVFLVTMINIMVLLLPFMVILLPFVDIQDHTVIISQSIYHKLLYMIYISAFLVSFMMLVYLVLDFLFGFSVRSYLKKCDRYEKLKDCDFLGGIFDDVKKKFNQKSVRLYVKNSNEVNAYAVSSVGTKAIVITRGMINHFLVESPNSQKFLNALRSIMGHEMSHLVNKDFLPSFLIIANQKATNFTSNFLRILFNIFSRILAFFPYGGRFWSFIITDLYSLLNWILTSFNRFIVMNIYKMLKRFISRSIEYRCDMQSAKAFGGENMALALSMLGQGGYFTIFSTHPATKSRTRRVKNVRAKDSNIHPRFFDSIANYFSLMSLVVICLYFAKESSIDLLLREYIKNHDRLHQLVTTIFHYASKIF